MNKHIPQANHGRYFRRKISRENLRNALEHLAFKQRETVMLFYFDGFSHSEIAIMLGEPLGTVKTRIRLALINLKKILNL